MRLTAAEAQAFKRLVEQRGLPGRQVVRTRRTRGDADRVLFVVDVMGFATGDVELQPVCKGEILEYRGVELQVHLVGRHGAGIGITELIVEVRGAREAQLLCRRARI